MRLLTYQSRIELPAAEVFAWHARPGALERLLPPWEGIRILRQEGGLEPGGRVVFRVRVGPFRRTCEVVHEECVEDELFVDRQVRGPFPHWVHSHRFIPQGESACTIEDRISYRLPGGAVGRLLAGKAVRRRLRRMLRFRHDRIRNDTARHRAFAQHGPQRIVVTGSSGLIGRALVPFLTAGGHGVVRLVRRAPDAERHEAYWDPEAGKIDTEALEGADAVVHLAGESIAARRWSRKAKERILRSRTTGTRLLCETLAKLNRRPRVLISASAIGHYGSRADEILSEQSGPGEGFLADVCEQWEAATKPAEDAGIRVVRLRTGFVLSVAGGGLARMLPAFRSGLGGALGSGRQWMSWIALDDLVGAIHHLIFTDVSGPVNAVAPGAVTNRTFTKVLGKVLGRPTIARAPAFAIRLLFGQMGRELMLSSTRVVPSALEASGFRHVHAELESALRNDLGMNM